MKWEKYFFCCCSLLLRYWLPLATVSVRRITSWAKKDFIHDVRLLYIYEQNCEPHRWRVWVNCQLWARSKINSVPYYDYISAFIILILFSLSNWDLFKLSIIIVIFFFMFFFWGGWGNYCFFLMHYSEIRSTITNSFLFWKSKRLFNLSIRIYRIYRIYFTIVFSVCQHTFEKWHKSNLYFICFSRTDSCLLFGYKYKGTENQQYQQETKTKQWLYLLTENIC